MTHKLLHELGSLYSETSGAEALVKFKKCKTSNKKKIASLLCHSKHVRSVLISFNYLLLPASREVQIQTGLVNICLIRTDQNI